MTEINAVVEKHPRKARINDILELFSARLLVVGMRNTAKLYLAVTTCTAEHCTHMYRPWTHGVSQGKLIVTIPRGH